MDIFCLSLCSPNERFIPLKSRTRFHFTQIYPYLTGIGRRILPHSIQIIECIHNTLF